MRGWSSRLTSVISAVLLLTINLAIPQPADASIHEIIAAMCRSGGEEVEPPGQNRFGTKSFVRALQATGFISSIEMTPGMVTINFDPTVPNSKFVSTGSDLVIPNGAGPGVTLVLSPNVIPDPNFPAHEACSNLN